MEVRVCDRFTDFLVADHEAVVVEKVIITVILFRYWLFFA